MDLEEFKGLVKDNPEAVAFLDTLNTTNQTNVERIGTLEKMNSDNIKRINNFQQGNDLVKSLFGIDQVNEETLMAVKESLGKSGGDEKLKNELNDIKNRYTEAQGNIEKLKSEHSQALIEKDKENIYLNSGVTSKLAEHLDDNGKKHARELILGGATIENGKLVYKNEDGTSIYNENNQPLSIDDRVNSFIKNPAYSGYIKADVLAGGGAKSSSQGGDNPPKISGDKKERQQAIADKYNLN